MSRKRLIAPGFFTNADLYDAEVSAQLPLRMAFAGLWTVTDRRGVFRWSRNLKPDVLPYDPCDILACLDALERAGFVVSYEVDGKKYGYIPTFTQHQTFHMRERPSADPAPPWQVTAQGQHGASGEEGNLESLVLAPEKQEEDAGTALAPDEHSASPTGTGTVSVTGTAELLFVGGALTDPVHRTAYEAYRASHRMPDGFDATLRSVHAPSAGGTGYAWEIIGAALVEMRGASATFSPAALRGFCRRLVGGEPAGISANGARNGRQDRNVKAIEQWLESTDGH